MSFPEIESDDEILTAKDVAANLKQSVRYAQKLFELGKIPSFFRGRERVCMKSWYRDYLQQLIEQERQRLHSDVPVPAKETGNQQSSPVKSGHGGRGVRYGHRRRSRNEDTPEPLDQ